MPTQLLDEAKQGHIYLHRFTGKRVLALQSGQNIDALELDVRAPNGVSARLTVQAVHLEPLPMTYFGGQVP